MLSEYGDFALNVKLVGKAGHVAQSGSIPRPVDRIELVLLGGKLLHIADCKLACRACLHLR